MATGRPETGELESLRRERDEARAWARQVEHEMGALRGRIKRLERSLWRQQARRRRIAALRARFARTLRR